MADTDACRRAACALCFFTYHSFARPLLLPYFHSAIISKVYVKRKVKHRMYGVFWSLAAFQYRVPLATMSYQFCSFSSVLLGSPNLFPCPWQVMIIAMLLIGLIADTEELCHLGGCEKLFTGCFDWRVCLFCGSSPFSICALILLPCPGLAPPWWPVEMESLEISYPFSMDLFMPIIPVGHPLGIQAVGSLFRIVIVFFFIFAGGWDFWRA